MRDGIPKFRHSYCIIFLATLAPVRPLFYVGIATIQPEYRSTHTAIMSYISPSCLHRGTLNKSSTTLTMILGSMTVDPNGPFRDRSLAHASHIGHFRVTRNVYFTTVGIMN